MKLKAKENVKGENSISNGMELDYWNAKWSYKQLWENSWLNRFWTEEFSTYDHQAREYLNFKKYIRRTSNLVLNQSIYKKNEIVQQ
jgi:hypothetical protein